MTSEPVFRDYVDTRFDALDQRLTATLQASERAIDIASEVLNARLISMNEFRATISDLVARAATKEQLDALRDAAAKQVELLREANLVKHDNVIDRIGDMRVQAAAISALATFLISIVLALVGRLLQR